MSTANSPLPHPSVLRSHQYVGIAMVAASAFASLWIYQLAERFRAPSAARALTTLQRWCRWACPRLGLQIQVSGMVPDSPCLFVSNHRTYLDVPVLAAVLGAVFLSRADVATWPIIGAVARLTAAVLVQRDDPRDRMRAARQLMRRVRTASVVVFAEGTTTGQPLPAPFHPGTFRLVQRLGVPIVPVTVRYSERRAYWVDDLTMWQHLRTRVLRGGPLRVSIDIGAPLSGREHADAERLAAAVYADVCRPIESCGELV